jgi:hypothetical protein
MSFQGEPHMQNCGTACAREMTKQTKSSDFGPVKGRPWQAFQLVYKAENLKKA